MDTVKKNLAIERIETKIAEFKESLDSYRFDFTVDGNQHRRQDNGTLLGLQIALDIVKDL
jgi:hypothetical protein